MQSTILITPALKSKILFYNYEYDYVVGNGTMVCVDMVEVPLQWGYIHLGLNNKCRPVILVP